MKRMSARSPGLTIAVSLLVILVSIVLSSARAPVLAQPEDYDYSWTDDFEANVHRPLWQWVNEDSRKWSLSARPGFLRIMTHVGSVGAENLLSLEAPAEDYRVATRVTFEPLQNYQIAGLAVCQDNDNYLMLGRAYCDSETAECVGNGIYFVRAEGGVLIGDNFATTTASQDEAYLRVVREGRTYSGYYSEDGSNWTLVGRHTPSVGVGLTKVGLTAAQGGPEIPADFEFFQLEAKFPSLGYAYTDDFSATALGLPWSWVNEDPRKWSLSARPGFLRIMTHPGNVGAENLLLMDVLPRDLQVTTRVMFEPHQNYQAGGLVAYQDNDNYLLLGRLHCDSAPPACVGNGIYFMRVEDGRTVGGNFAATTVSLDDAYLRVVREGRTYSGYYSEDGLDWVLIGSHTPGSGVEMTKVGVTAAQGSPEIPADFEFFQLGGEFPSLRYASTDDFGTTSLGRQWSWVNENARKWSLSARPGFLRIMTHTGGVGAENLLLMDTLAGDLQVTTRVMFAPQQNYQAAGLVAYQDNDNYLLLGRLHCDAAAPACVGNGIYFMRVEDGRTAGGNFATTTASQGDAHLRLVREGNTYSGYYSEDGTDWAPIGWHTPGSGVDLTKVGLTAAQGGREIPADFDFFRRDTETGYRQHLPLILKSLSQSWVNHSRSPPPPRSVISPAAEAPYYP